MRKLFTLLLVCCSTLLSAQITTYKFDFSGKKKAKEGYILVTPETLYTPETGYGYDFVVGNGEQSAVDSQQPFYFSVDVPDGNYRVTVVVGNRRKAGVTTLRGESRRLFYARH